MFDFPNPLPLTTRPPRPFDWHTPCLYDEKQKAAFHRAAITRLKLLAQHLKWDKAQYDLRTNKAGIAVSGEITLHHERVYICVSQSRMGSETGILFRSCNGRMDYSGGTNNFAPLRLLDDIPALAARLQALIPAPD